MCKFYCTLIFLQCSLLYSPTLLAQQTFATKAKLIFQHTDLAQVPTHHLKEFGYSIFDMNTFNGALVDSNVCDITTLRALYASYMTGYVGRSAPSIPNIPAVNTTIANVEATGVIPISLLFVDYNDYRPDALSANLIRITNEQIYDIAGRASSPYRNQRMFAAAPSFDHSTDAVTKFLINADVINTTIPDFFGTTIVVNPPGGGGTSSSSKILKDTVTTNAKIGGGGPPLPTNIPPYKIEIDFADGNGFRTVTLGTVMNISYTNTGIYRVKVKLTSPAGVITQSWFNFTAKKAAPCTGCLYVAPYTILDDPSFHNDALHSGATVSYILSTNNPTNHIPLIGKIIKPLIVAPGFNMHAVAPHLADRATIESFLSSLVNTFPFQFNDNLDIAQYDLIYIEYNNGTDDITRNAELFKAVVRKVNSIKVPNNNSVLEQNVVMGVSMGGLVTRYGLADMVSNNENTQTRLLVTDDSPHRGANVPLGIQFFGLRAGHDDAIMEIAQIVDVVSTLSSAGDIILTNIWRVLTGNLTDVRPLSRISISDISFKILEAGKVLSAPAPAQMLLKKANYIAFPPPVPNLLYFTRVDDNTFLSTTGQYRPKVDRQTPYTIVAASNGSQCAQNLFNSSSILLQAGGSVGLGIPYLLTSGIKTSLTVVAPSEFSTTNVVDFKLYKTWRLFFLDLSMIIDQFTASAPPQPNYDGAPGGTLPLPGTFSTGDANWLPWYANLNQNDNLTSLGQQEFCFVPTASALDVTNFNASALAQPYISGYNAVNPSKFSNFIAQNQNPTPLAGQGSYNSSHTSFTARSGRWIFDQMQNSISGGVPQECSTECATSGNTIYGATTVCFSQTYSVVPIVGVLVVWSTTPSNAATISPDPSDPTNSSKITLTRIGNSNVAVVLKAQLNSCVSSTLKIDIGTPPAFRVTETSRACPPRLITAEYKIDVVTPNTTYAWQCTGCDGAIQYAPGDYTVHPNIYAPITIAHTYNNAYSLSVTATRTNTCGTVSYNPQSWRPYITDTNCGNLRVALSPNPASNTLNINVVEINQASTSSKIDPNFQVTISDLVGNIKYNNKHNSIDSQIDISQLVVGNYSLRVVKGLEVINKTFSVAK